MGQELIENMNNVIPLFQKRRFTLSEAEKLLPLIRKFTREAVGRFLLLEQKLKASQADPIKVKTIELEVGTLLDQWAEKITKLGCEAKGIWLVDFDNGEGYYCWRYDEETIGYFHSYQEGFTGRTPIV